MTKLLLKLFVKDYKNRENSAVRSAVGKLSGVVGIVLNVVLCGFKLLVGMLSGSVSITADAMNNLTDATSSVVTLVGFRLAEKPADEDHPYGHARYEYLSGLAVAALAIAIGVEMARTSVEKIIHPSPLAISVPVVLVLAGSVLAKLWMFLFNRFLGKHIASSALLATSADSRNDCIATGVVLIASVAGQFTDFPVDGLMGLAVAVFILLSGWDMAKQTISPLLGEAASPELTDLIIRSVCSDHRVLGYHDLMVHDYGPGQRFASIHVEMDKDEDPLLCHEIIDNIERHCLQQNNVHLVIHYDPVVTGDERLEQMRSLVTQLLQQQDSRLSIHDFRMVVGKGHTNLIFDITLPLHLIGKEKQIQKTLEKALAETCQSQYYTVITFDPEPFNRTSSQ